MLKKVDKSQYQAIQDVIQQNPTISGFDLYYLGFFSHFVEKLNLNEIFKHIGNIINLHQDKLITSEEKIEFLIRMLAKKIDDKAIRSLNPKTDIAQKPDHTFLHTYFSQILKLFPNYPNVSKFQVFYLGLFHAICPSAKISELFNHINNINALHEEGLIDEETQIDLLLKILNKKIGNNANTGTGTLNIPREGLSPNHQASPAKSQVSEATREVQNHIHNEPERVRESQEDSRRQEEDSRRQAEDSRNQAEESEHEGDKESSVAEVNEVKLSASLAYEPVPEIVVNRVVDKQFSFMGQKSQREEEEFEEEEETRENVEERQSERQSERSEKSSRGEAMEEQRSERDSDDLRIKETVEDYREEGSPQVTRRKKKRIMVVQKKRTTEEKKFDSESDGEMIDEDDKKRKPALAEVAEWENQGVEEEEEERRSEQASVLEGSRIGRNNTDRFNRGETMEEEEEKVEESQREVVASDKNTADNEEEEEQPVEQEGEEIETPAKEKERSIEAILVSAGQESLIMLSGDKTRETEMEIEIEGKSTKRIPYGEDQEEEEREDLGENPALNVSNPQDKDQQDVEQLKSQLYPASSGQSKEVGTLDDILHRLLDGSQADPQSLNNSIQPSLESRNESPHKRLISLLNKKPKSSNMEEEKQAFTAPKSVAQMLEENNNNVIEEEGSKEGDNNDVQSEMAIEQSQLEVGDQAFRAMATQEDPHYPGSAKPSPMKDLPIVSQSDSILLGSMKTKSQILEGGQEVREYILQQAATYIQYHRQDEDGKLIIEANTQIDATPEEIPEEAQPTPADSLSPFGMHGQNAEVGEALICATVKQTLSQHPKEYEERDENFEGKPREGEEQQVQEKIERKKTIEEEEAAEEPFNRKNTESSAWSHSRRETMMEMYDHKRDEVGFTQITKASSIGGMGNTFDEERLARDLLASMEKEKRIVEELEKEPEQQEMVQEEPQKEVEVPEPKISKLESFDEERRMEDNEREDEDENGSRKKVVKKSKAKSQEEWRKPDLLEEELKKDDSRSKMEEIGKRSLEKPPTIVIQKPEEKKVESEVKAERMEDPNRCSLCKKALILFKTRGIEQCNHVFHEECFKEYLEKAVDSQIPPVTCPRRSCSTAIPLIDMLDLLDVERQEKYVTFTLREFVNTNEAVTCCPTPGCHYSFLKASRPDKSRCPLCEKTYCMACQVEWHKDISCEDYKKIYKGRDEEKKKFVEGRCKQCLNCKAFVAKQDGTSNMKCKCGSTFCYSCKRGLKSECNCQEDDQNFMPIVHPDLFHKVMQTPPEFMKLAKPNMKPSPTKKRVLGNIANGVGHVYKPAGDSMGNSTGKLSPIRPRPEQGARKSR